MSYKELVDIAGLYRTEDVVKKLSKAYLEKELNGFNYFEYKALINTTAIITPLQEVHHEGTAFLLELRASATPINTVLSVGNELKKFLDFLLIWAIDLLDVNVNVKLIMIGFINHLRVLDIYKPKTAIQWSFLTKVPMHRLAKNNGKIMPIGYDKDDFMNVQSFEAYSIKSIESTVSTALYYINFLIKRTNRYKDISMSEIPKKQRKQETMLSGTMGITYDVVFNVRALLGLAGLDVRSIDHTIRPLEEEVFLPEEVDLFMKAIEDDDAQNILLYNMLKCFGLRRAELANVMIDSSTIPKNFYDWDFNDALDYLKMNLSGDIEFSTQFGYWVCKVRDRGNTHRDKQNKTKNRDIRLLRSFMSSDEFASMLVAYLQVRQFEMRLRGVKDHNYLLISVSNRSYGQPITGSTILTRYKSIIKKSPHKDRLKKFTPHTFRHFFATYLIRVKKMDINDVSELLGHKDVATTRMIYLHYLPQVEDSEGNETSQASKIGRAFKEGFEIG
jgi:integrase